MAEGRTEINEGEYGVNIRGRLAADAVLRKAGSHDLLEIKLEVPTLNEKGELVMRKPPTIKVWNSDAVKLHDTGMFSRGTWVVCRNLDLSIDIGADGKTYVSLGLKRKRGTSSIAVEPLTIGALTASAEPASDVIAALPDAPAKRRGSPPPPSEDNDDEIPF